MSQNRPIEVVAQVKRLHEQIEAVMAGYGDLMKQEMPRLLDALQQASLSIRHALDDHDEGKPWIRSLPGGMSMPRVKQLEELREECQTNGVEGEGLTEGEHFNGA